MRTKSIVAKWGITWAPTVQDVLPLNIPPLLFLFIKTFVSMFASFQDDSQSWKRNFTNFDVGDNSNSWLSWCTKAWITCVLYL